MNNEEVKKEDKLKDLLEILKSIQQMNEEAKLKAERIYDIDPYITEINNITHQYYLYGNPYAKDSSVVNCSINILFKNDSYTITIEVVNDCLLKKNYPYSTFPDDESISVLPKQLGKKLLAKVKEV